MCYKNVQFTITSKAKTHTSRCCRWPGVIDCRKTVVRLMRFPDFRSQALRAPLPRGIM